MAEEAEQVSTNGVVDTKRQSAAAKRRQYSEALKRQMVAETQVPGASVSIVARRHDVNSNELFVLLLPPSADHCANPRSAAGAPHRALTVVRSNAAPLGPSGVRV